MPPFVKVMRHLRGPSSVNAQGSSNPLTLVGQLDRGAEEMTLAWPTIIRNASAVAALFGYPAAARNGSGAGHVSSIVTAAQGLLPAG